MVYILTKTGIPRETTLDVPWNMTLIENKNRSSKDRQRIPSLRKCLVRKRRGSRRGVKSISGLLRDYLP